MKKTLISVLALICILSKNFGQDSFSIKQNAIKIDRQDSLGEDIYEVVSGYQLFMVGELHGTKEPARFVQSLAELFLHKGDSVQIGLEIRSGLMKKYLSNPTDSNVFTSDFFSQTPYDGRPCFALAELIAQLSRHPHVEFFFYDINIGEFENFDERDSLMYLKIKQRILHHPDWKTITLGGNIHAMLKPVDGKTKMALFLLHDKELEVGRKLLTINHSYATGTYWDNSGQSLQIYQSDHSHSTFATAVGYQNYFYVYPQNAHMNFRAIYFTRKLTASPLVYQ